MTEKIQILFNGERTQVEVDTSVEHWVTRVTGCAEHAGIAVAINAQVVTRSQWPGRLLQPGDQLELIHAVQGG
jgi:sulfur carrier protein